MACLQEANKQVPGVADTLCLAAKAWSDTCYMDEIQSPFKERLTMQDRHDVNKKAMEYAKQVGAFMSCICEKPLFQCVMWQQISLPTLAVTYPARAWI